MNNHKILQDLDNAFKIYNIPLYLMYGTLLGSIRENDFIDNDTDIDVLFKKSDIEVSIIDTNFLKNILNDKFNVKGKDKRNKNYNKKWFLSHKNISGLTIDLYILENYNEMFLVRGTKEQGLFDRRYFEGFDLISMRDYEYKIPKCAKKFLRKLYGNWEIKNSSHKSNKKLEF